ncbi:hypothetical protein VF_0171 [Aliivibrio fischeri ES114]|uniref:Uncharacterized protein n=1 Tax=Aliivibrio fischeri (strain ATCC 700601 / ES114) TaxID=312309 RepID=Q5E8I0_ALIF1|nr:hypothetical protein [Aliivibrio fischeri]AAW84666.1 hypothetical protein VF_0171 [Aliivibrio fischeri ES114]KLU78884.1 hypothetical protein AB192_09630 [Aliivibrio fischeri]
MEWSDFSDDYDMLFCDSAVAKSIKQDIYVNKLSRIKSIVKVLFLFFRKNKCIDFKYNGINNLYVLESMTPSNFKTINPIFELDKSSKLIIVTTPVFQRIDNVRYRGNLFNIDDYTFVNIGDFINSLHFCRRFNNKFRFVNIFQLIFLYLRASSLNNVLNELFSNVKCNNIILTNDTLGLSNLIVQNSRVFNIKNYVLQHGLPTKFYFPTSADNYIVWGRRFVSEFKNKGARSKLYSLGSPKVDEVMKYCFSDAKYNDFLKRYNISNNKKIFTYFSNSHAPELDKKVHEINIKLLNGLISHKDYHVCIKLHPSESMQFIKEVLQPYDGKYTIIDHEDDVYDLVKFSSYCASIYSTLLIESMCLGTYTFQFNATKSHKIPDYSNGGGCVEINSFEQLELSLNASNKNKILNQQLKYTENYFSNQGTSSEKILELIHERNCI